MRSATQEQIVQLVKRSGKILVLPSSPPDGDSIGSAISLYLALGKLGKEVTVICADPIPDVLQFLPNTRIIANKVTSTNDFIITIDLNDKKIQDIKHEIENNKVNIIISPKEGSISESDISFTQGEVDYDLIITVDTAELEQLRGFYENNIDLFHKIPVVNIDHHISNAHFGKVNHVDIMASSTTELILPIFEQIAGEEGIDIIDEDIATLLLTGIITDTGSFQNANTTPKAFAASAKLISYGARQQEIIQHIYKTKQLSQLKLWGRVLSKIQTDEKHRIVWSVVSQQDFKDTESVEDQTGDIIDELMTNAPGAEVILLLKEREDGSISISVRTTSASVSSATIAEHFGGGGHTQAAGFRLNDMDPSEAEYKVLDYVKKFQDERLGLRQEEAEDENESSMEAMIDVEELMERAEEAQKATEFIDKVKVFNPKNPQEKPTEPPSYKFED